MDFVNLIKIFIAASLVNNIILLRFIGLCPYIGMSREISGSIGMSIAVTFVTVLASTSTWVLNKYALVPLKMEYLQILVFILVIASLVQLVELYLKKMVPTLYKAMGIYLPLITTNCAILATTFYNVYEKYNFMQSLMNSLGISIGFGIALIILAGLRRRVSFSNVPKFMEDTPIVFLVTALAAIAFMGFQGMIK